MEGAIKNGQYRDHGNIGHKTLQRQTKRYYRDVTLLMHYARFIVC